MAVIQFEWNGQEYAEELVGKLEVKNLSMLEIKEALNRAPAKLAFWTSIQGEVEDALDVLTSSYELWYAKAYFSVKAPTRVTRDTEGYRRQRIYLEKSAIVRKYLSKRNRLISVKRRVAALVKAYDAQSRTLQTLGGLVRRELDLVPTAGTRDLNKL